MYVSENCDDIILSEFMKERKKTQLCSGYLSNLNLMNFNLHSAVSSLAVSFTQFLIGSLKRVLLQHLFLSLSASLLLYNARRLMSQMTLTKNNLKNWVLIRFSWYVCYLIGWIVAWLRIYSRCHNFFR